MKMKKFLLLVIVSMFAVFSTVASVYAQESMDSDATISFEGGLLTLDVVPSVEFDGQTIVAEEVIYQSETTDPFVQVTDNRGTGAGWNVTAQMGNFMENGAETLPGAVLTFSNGAVDEDTSTSNPPRPNRSIVLNPGGDATEVVTAGENEGLGLWITRWLPEEPAEEDLNDNVTLLIPAGSATTGTHTATITWQLIAAPQ